MGRLWVGFVFIWIQFPQRPEEDAASPELELQGVVRLLVCVLGTFFNPVFTTSIPGSEPWATTPAPGWCIWARLMDTSGNLIPLWLLCPYFFLSFSWHISFFFLWVPSPVVYPSISSPTPHLSPNSSCFFSPSSPPPSFSFILFFMIPGPCLQVLRHYRCLHATPFSVLFISRQGLIKLPRLTLNLQPFCFSLWASGMPGPQDQVDSSGAKISSFRQRKQQEWRKAFNFIKPASGGPKD